MTVSTTTTKISYTGNGVTTAFPVPFVFFGDSEIEVVERTIATGSEITKTLTTHYTVSGGDGATGTVTAVTAPSSSVEWHIRRRTARTQLVDYTPNDPFPAETHEIALDRAAAISQEIGEIAERALVVPVTDSTSVSLELPNSIDRASKYLAFGADGKPVATAGTTSLAVISTFAEQLLDDASAAAMLATLGVSAFAQTLVDDADAATARGTLGVSYGVGVRERLTAARTYYVRTDGSDANTGLANTAGGAFLTIQKAVNVVARSLDLSGYVVTIQVGDGTYDEAVVLPPLVGAPDGVGAIILGNTGTPANVHVNTTGAGDSFKVLRGSNEWKIDSLKASSANGSAVSSDLTNAGPCSLVINALHVGACPNGHHFRAEKQGIFRITGNFTVSGNAGSLFVAAELGHILCQGMTVTLSGTPAFSLATAYARGCGVMRINGITFSGSATGKRYDASDNGDIQTSGGGASYVPGNSAGSTATGGQYT